MKELKVVVRERPDKVKYLTNDALGSVFEFTETGEKWQLQSRQELTEPLPCLLIFRKVDGPDSFFQVMDDNEVLKGLKKISGSAYE